MKRWRCSRTHFRNRETTSNLSIMHSMSTLWAKLRAQQSNSTTLNWLSSHSGILSRWERPYLARNTRVPFRLCLHFQACSTLLIKKLRLLLFAIKLSHLLSQFSLATTRTRLMLTKSVWASFTWNFWRSNTTPSALRSSWWTNSLSVKSSLSLVRRYLATLQRNWLTPSTCCPSLNTRWAKLTSLWILSAKQSTFKWRRNSIPKSAMSSWRWCSCSKLRCWTSKRKREEMLSKRTTSQLLLLRTRWKNMVPASRNCSTTWKTRLTNAVSSICSRPGRKLMWMKFLMTVRTTRRKWTWPQRTKTLPKCNYYWATPWIWWLALRAWRAHPSKASND